MRYVNDCRRASVLSVLLALLALAFGGMATRARSSVGWHCREGLDGLLVRLSKVRATRAQFHEEKHIALLGAPLISEGTVYFAAPDILLRDQRAPVRAAMLLEGDTVHFLDESGRRSINLARWEAAQGLVSGYIKVLQGDASGLRRHYHTKFSCDGDDWTLELLPRSSALKKLLRSMRLQGSRTRLTHSEMLDAYGDRTSTAFSGHVSGDAAADTGPQLKRRFEATFGSTGAR